MYLILVYDVGQERVGKVCRTLRRRLTWVQNSVFEGEVSEANFKQIQADLSKIIDGQSDSVLFYCIQNPRGWEKRVMGQEKLTTDTFL
ncbi:MAG: CRISPR-associated endonuclease Cas2 [Abitibacteriaceae bacterium]|nr:CRISPR-associated endonuclease Cas2 [Abditibacteriaceae bacterium]